MSDIPYYVNLLFDIKNALKTPCPMHQRIRTHGGAGMAYKEWGFKSGGTELFNAYSLCHTSSGIGPASI